MTKFEVWFEFLAGKIGLCDSKHALSCQTCEKSPKIVNIYSKIPKFSCQTRLIAKLNSWKEIWISHLEAPPSLPHMSAIAGAHLLMEVDSIYTSGDHLKGGGLLGGVYTLQKTGLTGPISISSYKLVPKVERRLQERVKVKVHLTRGPQDPCTSKQVELLMGMVREFEINVERQYFSLKALFNDSLANMNLLCRTQRSARNRSRHS